MNGVARNVYNGASSLGLFMSYIGLFIAMIISFGLFYFSYKVFEESNKNPEHKQSNVKTANWYVFAIIGLIILLIGIGNFYLTKNYKFYAAGQGVNTIFGGKRIK
jgi:hypothetical protein